MLKNILLLRILETSGKSKTFGIRIFLSIILQMQAIIY